MEPREATYERDEVDGPLSDAKTGDEVIKVKKVHDETTETFKKPNPTPSEADVSSSLIFHDLHPDHSFIFRLESQVKADRGEVV